MKFPATHPLFPGVFLDYFRASETTKINHMRSNSISNVIHMNFQI